MLLLAVFAFVAGAATAVSPCVLPVLPLALSAGATGGRRRPLGVVCGLVVSFAFASVVLVYVIDALGLPDGLVRTIAIVVLLVFGISLLVPSAAARVEAWISRVVPAPRSPEGRGGFTSGVGLGASLGLVYAPCAGPILAGVITVSASQSFTAGRLAVALAYALGSGVVLYLLMRGGRRLRHRLTRHAGRLQWGMGAVMVVVAGLMLADYDIRFQTAIADHLPSFLVNPSKGLEDTASARGRLADLRGRGGRPGLAASDTSAAKALPVLGQAPDFTRTGQWFNTPGGRRLSLRDLRGKVVLVDFWTYTCINCIRTLPQLRAWDARYRRAGLVIVGVHTPEFPFERDAGNVRDAIDQNHLRYPVAQDNDYGTWQAWGNQYWPATYFVDARGRVRFAHFGEGDDERQEQVIRTLLAEAGHRPARPSGSPAAETPSPGVTTPESYLGAERADRFVNDHVWPGVQTFRMPASPPPADHLAYGGVWRIGRDAAEARRGARLEVAFNARRVFLVLGSRGGRPRSVGVRLDGRTLPDHLAGADVRGGRLGVRRQRLYRVVDLPGVERHVLTLDLDSGVSGYAFTFG